MVNFLLGLNKKVWLLIGKSISDGACVYPLTLETLDKGPCYIIWYQGQPYKVNEPHNPVKVVSALVNHENVSALLRRLKLKPRSDSLCVYGSLSDLAEYPIV